MKHNMKNLNGALRRWKGLGLGLGLLSALAAPASAQRGEPASLLLMPEFDSRGGALTLLTVTNTNPDQGIDIEWVYVEESNCLEGRRSDSLGPGDTLSVIAGVHMPSQEHGYVYVYAKEADEPVAFDWLIGQCMTANGFENLQYSVEPFAFQAAVAEGEPTDLNDDGVRDLNGLEYSRAAEELHFPRFLGQTYLGLESDLILINLTGARQYDAVARLEVWNDNAESFETSYRFHCWERVPLLDIAGEFDNSSLQATNNDPAEIIGLRGWESGWFSLGGDSLVAGNRSFEDPALLAVLVDVHDGNSSATLPFAYGEQSNGSLVHPVVPTNAQPFCLGESGCPCGNDSAPGALEGCVNATGGGARLTVAGTPSVSSDTVQLIVSGAVADTPGIFLQNVGLASPAALQDGLLCLALDGHLVRHIDPANGIVPIFTDAAGDGVSEHLITEGDWAGDTQPGATIYYQFWFRDPLGPCGSEANVSSGISLTWSP